MLYHMFLCMAVWLVDIELLWMFVCALAVARRPDKSSLDSPQQQHTLQQTHAHRNDPFPQRPKLHCTTKCTMRTACCLFVSVSYDCIHIQTKTLAHASSAWGFGDFCTPVGTYTNIYALLYALARPKRPLHIRINTVRHAYPKIYTYIHGYTQTSSNGSSSSSVAEQAARPCVVVID